MFYTNIKYVNHTLSVENSSFFFNELPFYTQKCFTALAGQRTCLQLVCGIPGKMAQDKMPQIRQGKNATKRKPDKMPQNKDASKI